MNLADKTRRQPIARLLPRLTGQHVDGAAAGEGGDQRRIKGGGPALQPAARVKAQQRVLRPNKQPGCLCSMTQSCFRSPRDQRWATQAADEP